MVLSIEQRLTILERVSVNQLRLIQNNTAQLANGNTHWVDKNGDVTYDRHEAVDVEDYTHSSDTSSESDGNSIVYDSTSYAPVALHRTNTSSSVLFEVSITKKLIRDFALNKIKGWETARGFTLDSDSLPIWNPTPFQVTIRLGTHDTDSNVFDFVWRLTKLPFMHGTTEQGTICMTRHLGDLIMKKLSKIYGLGAHIGISLGAVTGASFALSLAALVDGSQIIEDQFGSTFHPITVYQEYMFPWGVKSIEFTGQARPNAGTIIVPEQLHVNSVKWEIKKLF